MAKKKFATKISEDLLEELRAYAHEAKRSISSVLDEALTQHLQNVRVRPAFRSAAARVMDEHSKLLKRLAK